MERGRRGSRRPPCARLLAAGGGWYRLRNPPPARARRAAPGKASSVSAHPPLDRPERAPARRPGPRPFALVGVVDRPRKCRRPIPARSPLLYRLGARIPIRIVPPDSAADSGPLDVGHQRDTGRVPILVQLSSLDRNRKPREGNTSTPPAAGERSAFRVYSNRRAQDL